MKVVAPITIDDSVLDSTNVAETLAAYNAGTSYSLGQQVRDDTTHHAFESLAGGNMGNALTDATKWLDLGATNPWAMFDEFLETQTSNADTIEVVVVPAERADTLLLFNLDAASVTVTETDAVDGVVFGPTTYSLTSNDNVGDYYDYCFQPIIRKTQLAVEDLPPYIGPDITVTIDNTGSTAKCGLLALGLARELGATVYGAKVGIVDYSVKKFDTDFGRTQIVERSYRSTGSFRVVIQKNMFDEVKRILTERRAKFSVFIGSGEYASTIIGGFPSTWDETIEHLEQSALNIEIEGVI